MEDFSTVDLEPGRGDVIWGGPLRWALAVLAPLAVAAALIPFRSDLSHSAGIILVLPVVVLGLSGGARFGLVAAVSAAFGFDVFLVTPYLHPGIDRTEDVVATLVLLIVGVLVGLVGSRLTRFDHRSDRRLRELSALAAHAEAIISDLGQDDLLTVTAANLTTLLDLQSCEWEPRDCWDPRATVGQPTLLDNGQIIGRLGDLPNDRGKLPTPLELVVSFKDVIYGRFLVEPAGSRASIEERRFAMTICRLTAARLGAEPRTAIQVRTEAVQ